MRYVVNEARIGWHDVTIRAYGQDKDLEQFARALWAAIRNGSIEREPFEHPVSFDSVTVAPHD